MLLGNAALVQRLVPLFWKRVCVKGDKGVLGVVLLEAGVESEEPGEVGRVRNEGRPDYVQLSVGLQALLVRIHLPFFWSAIISEMLLQMLVEGWSINTEQLRDYILMQTRGCVWC